MTNFDYEQSIWGKGEASLAPSSPTAFRLREALRVIEPLTAGRRVLEVGSGAGQFIRAVKILRPELVCLGTDISEAAIAEARSFHDGVEYKLGIDNHFPYEDKSLDAVLIFDVLEHVLSPDLFVKEIYRVLKPGGLLYVFVPCEGDGLSLWHMLRKFGIKGDLTQKYAGHIQYFSRGEVFALFTKNNFSITRRRYSEHFFGQILGIAAFLLMDQAGKKSIEQINNEAYFTSQRQSKIVWLAKKFVNSFVYLESIILSRLSSPNLHLGLKKL